MKPYTMTDAEAELRDAIDRDDREAIARLEPIIDKLDTKFEPATLHASALWYAAAGVPVFPLQPGTKIPLKGSHGCKDATPDYDQVNAWWTAIPEANIGLATGYLFDAVDIDGLAGQRSRLARWDDLFETIDNDNVGKVLTPRPGGMHIYVPATGDGNATNIVPSVDYRGVGGYVVAPPSATDVGRYQWLGAPRFTAVVGI